MIYEQLYVGIDISKLKHDIAIMNEAKKLVRRPIVIQDSYDGYHYLLGIFNQLQQQYATKKFHLGLEATSDYWKNIYYFLKQQSDAFVLTVLNPIRTRAFVQSELRRARTDPVAAKDIALFMVEKQPAPSIDRAPMFDGIKDLDGQIYVVKKQQTMISNKLRLELTKVAPEIEKAVRGINGQQLLSLLQNFPTAAAIAHAAVAELATVQYGKHHWSLPLKFIQKMKALATNSIAYKTGPGAGYVVQSLVRRIMETQQEAELLKRQLVEQYQLVKEHDSVLTSITGISQQVSMVLEAYIGDVHRFPNAKKMVAYFGMNPTIDESGSSKKRKSHLQKKGSGIVRQKLFMVLLSIIRSQHGPIYDYYARLVAAGKPKLVAIAAAMRKLLVIIYHMLKNQEQFDPNKM